MLRDIDMICQKLCASVPAIHIEQLKVKHRRADDDGLWFMSIHGRTGEIQVESTEGKCPFLIESDFNSERSYGHAVEEVVAKIRRLFAQA